MSAPQNQGNTNWLSIAIVLSTIIGGVGLFMFMTYNNGTACRGTIVDPPPASSCELLAVCDPAPCSDDADCYNKALLATQEAERNGMDDSLGSEFRSARAFWLATHYLRKSNGYAHIAELDAKASKSRADFETQFQQRRIGIHNFKKRKMYPEATDAIQNVERMCGHVDATCHKWALSQKQAMQDNATWSPAKR